MLYKEKEYKRIIFRLNPELGVNTILNSLENLKLNKVEEKSYCIKYAVLELISNSIRAHRKKKIDDPVCITFEENNSTLNVEIRDKGGGFDPRILPYNIEEPVDRIDFQSDAFTQYQKDHNYKRYGMGILLARKVFPVFAICFYNRTGEDSSWEEGNIVGTVVRISLDVD